MVLDWVWTMAWPLLPPSSPTFLILILLLAIFFLLLVNYLSRQPSHPHEPPILPCPLPIPYIGHLILMALQGGHYIRSLGLAHPELPIFTLVVAPSFGGGSGAGGGGRGQGRMYIVTSPSVTAAVQRRPVKELSANKHLPGVVSKIMGLDGETREIVERGIGAEHDGNKKNDGKDEKGRPEKGVLEDLHGMMVGYLGAGQELDQLTLESVRALVGEVDGFLEGLKKEGGGGNGQGEEGEEEEDDSIHDLLPWVRHVVIVASARVLYGLRNPFAVKQQHHRQQQQDGGDNDRRRQEGEEEEQDLETDFWNWDHGLGQLLVGVWPSVLARVPYFARERLVAAFRRYIVAEEYLPEDVKSTSSNTTTTTTNDDKEGIPIQRRTPRTGASPIVLNRIRIARTHGFSPDGVARSELSFFFAAMVNTATVAFWTLVRVYADPELLRAVRDELVRSGVVRDGGGGDDAGSNIEDSAVRPSPSTASTATAAEPGRAREKGKGKRRSLSLRALTRDRYKACPTLHAIFQEVLRLGSNNFSTRLVQEDTYITVPSTSSTISRSRRQEGQGEEKASENSGVGRGNGNVETRYLLQKGAIVQIAGGVMHLSRSLWGEDADEFRPQRHLGRHQSSSSSTKKAKWDESHPDNRDLPGDTSDSIMEKSTINDDDDDDSNSSQNNKSSKNHNRNSEKSTSATRTSAFRGFGGGKTICPGRYFATAETLGFVACVVLRMEMEGVAEGEKQQRGGSIKVPDLDDYILPVHILEPAPGEKVRARLRLREGAEGEKIDVVP